MARLLSSGRWPAGYVGLSVPVIGVGIALRFVSARVTLLAFAIAVAAGILPSSRILLGAPTPVPAPKTRTELFR
jgi:hypothetical protein